MSRKKSRRRGRPAASPAPSPDGPQSITEKLSALSLSTSPSQAITQSATQSGDKAVVQFTDLAQELRDQIWGEICNTIPPATIQARQSYSSLTFGPLPPVPIILRICQESKKFGEKYWTNIDQYLYYPNTDLGRAGQWKLRHFYANFGRDRFHMILELCRPFDFHDVRGIWPHSLPWPSLYQPMPQIRPMPRIRPIHLFDFNYPGYLPIYDNLKHVAIDLKFGLDAVDTQDYYMSGTEREAVSTRFGAVIAEAMEKFLVKATATISKLPKLQTLELVVPHDPKKNFCNWREPVLEVIRVCEALNLVPYKLTHYC